MSEPVIKAVGYKCPNCARLVKGALDCDCLPDAKPLYTRDDLVRVARETFIACGYEKDADAGGDVEIVDRLTKGET